MKKDEESGSLLIREPGKLSDDILINESLNISENESLYKQEVLEEGIHIDKKDIDISKL